MKYKTVLFDLDGTLTRSDEGITRSVIHAAEKMGITGLRKEDVLHFIGPPLQYSFQEHMGMTEAQAREAVGYYRERYSAVGWAENEVYRGIPHLLRSLKKHGARLAIVTGKPEEFARRIADRFCLSPFLDGIVGTDFRNTSADKADLIRRAVPDGPAVMIGDRKFDVEGGRANGIDTIGVGYGYGTREELEAAGATHIAATVADVYRLLMDGAPGAPGLFVTMEGMDGCGKTTQRTRLLEHLAQLGWETSVTREPGGDAVAEKIRDIILDPENEALCDETEAYLYAASRAQNVRTRILPAVRAGKAVVSDRFVDSSVAYQGGGRELGCERIAELNRMATGTLTPDLTVYLRMSPEQALMRRRSAGSTDRLERQKDAFYERTCAAYEALFAGKERVVTVNAGQPMDEVTAEMIEKVDRRIREILTE